MAFRISETMYFVRNFEEALDFYTRKLGFEVVQKYDWGFALLSLHGAPLLGICTADSFDPDWSPNSTLPEPRLAFQTSDIAAEYTRLKTAGVDATEPKGDPDGVRALTFFDGDGNQFFLWDDGTGK